MAEQRWRRPSLVGPAILILIGGLLLLGNLGLLHVDWWQLWRLWPIVLILAGLDILARHSRWGTALLAAVILALLGGFFYVLVAAPAPLLPALSGPQATLVLQPEAVDLSGARQVDVDIRMGAGQLEVGALSDSPRLFEGDLRYPDAWGGRAPHVSYDVSAGHGRLLLESRSKQLWAMPFGDSSGENWKVRLTREVPLNINVDAGASISLLDLRHLQLGTLTVKAGVGRMEVFFPSEGEDMMARIEGGVGSLVLRVPESVEARVSVSGGLGGQSFSGRFRPTGGHTYETAGYASAASRLDIRVDGGVGSLRVE